MRLTTVVLIASLLQVSASTFGQRITISQSNASIKSVLKEIRKQSGYSFVYDGKIITEDQKVTVKVINVSVNEALNYLLKGLDLTFKIDDKIVSIKKKEANFLETIVARYQSIDVRGRVTDKNGDPLAGATIKVQGTSAVTTSDSKGNFYLKGIEEGLILEVTYVGFAPLKIVAKSEIGDIKMNDVNAKLDEIQVIAYGTTTKKFNTSNMETISAKEIADQPVSNPLLALQGRTPGLFIRQLSGTSASNVSVNIQGLNSLQNGVSPFYVIDGVPYSDTFTGGNLMGDAIAGNSSGGSAFNFINPSDIESISILKDADATAIYGSRAANGAILITTKKGIKGRTKVNLNIRHGLGKVANKLTTLNTDQYLNMRREAYTNAGLPVPNAPSQFDYSNTDLAVWDQNRYTDWQKVLVGGTAQFTDAQASISGGNDNTQFLVSYNFNRQTTVYPNSLADIKGNLHFNLNQKPNNNKFKYFLTGTYLQDKNQLNSVDLMEIALKLAPNAPSLFKPDGSINWEPIPGNTSVSSFYNNPIAITLQKFTGKTTNLIGNNNFSYEIVPGLKLESNIGYTKLEANETTITPITIYSPEVATKTRSAKYLTKSLSTWILEPQLNYINETKLGRIEALFGATFQQTSNDALSQSGTGYSNDAQLENLASATSVKVNNVYSTLYRYNALYGRLNYRFKDRYILNFTTRRDGTSRFGEERKFHNFYAVGGAWLFSEEKLLKDNMLWLNFGKLRFSYGTTGSDQISDYAYLSTLSNVPGVGIPYQDASSLYPTKITNPLLQWEETRKLNLGTDLEFLKGRVQFTFNLYRNISSNQLVTTPLPTTTGFGFIQQNIPATIENKGVELMIEGKVLKSNKLNWQSSLNFTTNKNTLTSYENLETSTDKYALVIGQPINVYHAYKYAGVNPSTGLYEFINNKGERTSNPNNTTDRTELIDPNPKWFLGFYNNIQYKGFQLEFLLQYVQQKAQNSRFGNYPGFDVINQPAVISNRWKQAGDVSDVQKISLDYENVGAPYEAAVESDAWFSDASFLRLKNLSFSYTLPESVLHHLKISNVKIYFQGQNLFTSTKYVGTDPESKSLLYIPPLRVLAFGLQIGI